MISRQPVSESASPIQNDARGRRRSTSHDMIPTKIGVLLPRMEATAACVLRTAVFHSARSSAKNTPPATAIHAARGETAAVPPRMPRHVSSTTPAIRTR